MLPNAITWLRWKWAWLRWFHESVPFRPGDRTLGTGSLRRATLTLMLDRWVKREPKLEDFRK